MQFRSTRRKKYIYIYMMQTEVKNTKIVDKSRKAGKEEFRNKE